MSGLCKRVYVRLTPGEKDRAHDLVSRNGLTVSQLVRGSFRTDEAQRLLNVAAGNLEDLNVAVVQLREESHDICSHAIVSV